MTTDLPTIQREIGEWSRRNFGDQTSKATHQVLGSLAPLLGVTEELGELTHVVLKRHQGIRGYDNYEKYKAERDDAVADLMIYLCDFAEREGDLDVMEALERTWNKVKSRDWKNRPVDANKHETQP